MTIYYTTRRDFTQIDGSLFVQSDFVLENSYTTCYYEVIESQMHQLINLFNRLPENTEAIPKEELDNIKFSIPNLEDSISRAEKRLTTLKKDSMVQLPGISIRAEQWITGDMRDLPEDQLHTRIKTWESFQNLVADLKGGLNELKEIRRDLDEIALMREKSFIPQIQSLNSPLW